MRTSASQNAGRACPDQLSPGGNFRSRTLIYACLFPFRPAEGYKWASFFSGIRRGPGRAPLRGPPSAEFSLREEVRPHRPSQTRVKYGKKALRCKYGSVCVFVYSKSPIRMSVQFRGNPNHSKWISIETNRSLVNLNNLMKIVVL